MEGVPQADALIFGGSRWKAGLGALAGLGGVLLGWLCTTSAATIRHSETYYDVVGWLLIVFFGLCGIAFAVSLVAPQRLWIERDGFSFKRAWKTRRRYRWDEIDEIWVHYQRASGFVVWRSKNPSGTFTRSTFGFDGWLPGGWTMSPEELASELRSAKDQHDGVWC